MGFDLYLHCFGKTGKTGIPRSAVRSLFPIVEERSEPDRWRIRYDDRNSCVMSVTALADDNEMLKFLSVERPCGDRRLWAGLVAILRMGSIVIVWPGGPPIVADKSDVMELPRDLGEPTFVSSADQLLNLIRQT